MDKKLGLQVTGEWESSVLNMSFQELELVPSTWTLYRGIQYVGKHEVASCQAGGIGIDFRD